MRHFTLALGCSLLCLACSAQEPPAASSQAKPANDSTADVVSYGIGRQIGRQLKSEAEDLNIDQLVAGLRDELSGAAARYTEEQLSAAFAAFQQQMQARAQTADAENTKAGKAFLAANAAKPGVTTLPSGLQYKVLQPGQGTSPKPTDTVRVHYEGKLIDGTVFDSSLQRGQPATFGVNQVIPGWTEALQKMKVGGKWQLVIPPNLAYGERGAGQRIKPNSVLVFQVELLDIVDGN